MDAFTRLRRNLKKDFSGRQPVRVALLGDTATQWLAQAVRGEGYEQGLDLRIREADFDQIGQQVYDPRSALYSFDPEVIVVYQSVQKLLSAYNVLAPEARSGVAEVRMAEVEGIRAAIRAHSAATIIYYNYPEIDDGIFGNYANKTESSFLFQVRKLNYELMRYAARQEGFHVGDLAAVQQQTGRAGFFRSSAYVSTEMEISVEALPLVAGSTAGLIAALHGRVRKCLVLDLDNTLWGGVIGDDGLEKIEIGALGIGRAFTDFQYWVLKLRQRGVLLAVCSKNTGDIARQPFDSHPDMVLALEDIAVFQANWDNKVDNIRRIGIALRIGLDSMVFLDDNPFERNMVRAALPEVLVPELPDDPAEFLEYLHPLHLFETVSLSAEDGKRTALYRTGELRGAERLSYADEDAWLASLGMASRAEPFNSFNGPRVAQLSQRSNQFNLRTVRYTDVEVGQMAGSTDIFTFAFNLEDRFGDNGIIAAVILRKEKGEVLFIDSWFMSCRVLRRGMENFILNTIVDFAGRAGYRYLKGEYLATARNGMVSDHYSSLGFRGVDGWWVLGVYDYEQRPTWVKRVP